VILAVDVSLSISAQDVVPARLDRAKGAISALLDHLQGDRVGLVTFAGSADLRFPLTTDIEAARKVVQSLGFKDGGLRSGTSVGEALREATSGFANDQTRSKIVVLVSDGDELGDDAASAAAFVRDQGIGLNTIGVGNDTPVPVVVTDPRTGKAQPRIDPGTNTPLLTAADAMSLRQLASANGGHFYSGNTDDFAVQLADEIGRLQKTRFESGEGNVPVERFQLFAGAGLLLLMLEFLLPAGRSRRGFARLAGIAALGASLRPHRSREVRPRAIAPEPRLGGYR
jgi:Ca-activated chloride channel family protein